MFYYLLLNVALILQPYFVISDQHEARKCRMNTEGDC